MVLFSRVVAPARDSTQNKFSIGHNSIGSLGPNDKPDIMSSPDQLLRGLWMLSPLSIPLYCQLDLLGWGLRPGWLRLTLNRRRRLPWPPMSPKHLLSHMRKPCHGFERHRHLFRLLYSLPLLLLSPTPDIPIPDIKTTTNTVSSRRGKKAVGICIRVSQSSSNHSKQLKIS